MAVKALVEAEFAAENLVVEDDKLHESLGHEGPRLAVYPERERPMGSNRLVLNTELIFQFFDSYERDIDPEQAVSPAIIEEKAERFKRALQKGNSPSTGHLWYFDIEQIEYPRDPTGNKSRFVATILARSQNAGLVETTG